MPALFWKPCRSPGCPEVIQKGAYCEKCRSQRGEAYENRRKKTAARGYGGSWRKLRKIILNRDPVCVACNRKPSTDVDHIKPLASGGDNSLDNLQGLCHECHSRKTATQDSNFAGNNRGNKTR